jgi:hypothetical protein
VKLRRGALNKEEGDAMKIRKQNGMTLMGFLITLVVVLFFAYAAMRLIPTYLEYYSLVSAMETLQSDPNSKNLSPGQIKQKVQTSLWVSYSDNNIETKHMRITKKSGGISLRVKYEVRKPFLGNIDIVASFDRSVLLR